MNEAIEALMQEPVPNIGFPTMLVGGAVRDALLGVKSKDLDFSVEAPSFEAMIVHATEVCGDPFVVTPETFTARFKNPVKGGPALDFVLARKDGPSSDNRRPDFVEAGTFEDDMMRRDFTVNAMGLDLKTGDIFDPTGGMRDLERMCLRFVGNPGDRITEDALRVVRAMRFEIVKGLKMETGTWDAVSSPAAALLVQTLPVERIRPELEKMLVADTLATLEMFECVGAPLVKAMFRDGLRLSATGKTRARTE